MKKVFYIVYLLLFVPALFLQSCDRGDDPGEEIATPAFSLMKDYMVSNNLDIDKILTSPSGAKFVAAPPADADLASFLAKYYMMDIRSAADYAKGHIEGAKNVAFANILTEAANSNGKPILMICYTGQTACYGTALLRLYGYSEAQALKWGMSGWNSSTAGSWNNNIGNEAAGHSNWSYSAAPANQVYKDPTINSFSQDGSAILKARVEQVVSEGFKTVKGTDVLNAPSNYFINNYFSDADYNGFGHIANANKILPWVLADNSYLAFDPDANAKIATYCYTGQTSAVLTACLRVLGYDAYSLTFGMNGLYNSNPAWTSNKWSESVPKNLPLVN